MHAVLAFLLRGPCQQHQVNWAPLFLAVPLVVFGEALVQEHKHLGSSLVAHHGEYFPGSLNDGGQGLIPAVQELEALVVDLGQDITAPELPC